MSYLTYALEGILLMLMVLVWKGNDDGPTPV